MKNDKNVISIDFGTSRTKMAHYDAPNQKMELFRIGDGEMPYIPTTFYLASNGERYLGDNALEFIHDDPLGFLDEPLKRCLRETVILTGNGQKSTPLELLSLLFKTLREKASQKAPFINKPPTSAVLTIPVQYGPADEELLKRAAINAGFYENQLTFIHEPVAAAQAWFSETKKSYEYIVVLDCGGGTLDWACLQQKKSGGFEILAELSSGGDNRIGGYDIDEELFKHVISNANQDEIAFCRSNRTRILHQLRGIKERCCKTQTGGEIRLSKQRIPISPELINSIIDNRYIKQAIKTISPYLDRVRNFINEPRPKVLMVGGSSRLTKLCEALQEDCVCETLIWERSEFATVLGALYGHIDDMDQIEEKSLHSESGHTKDVPSNKQVQTTDSNKDQLHNEPELDTITLEMQDGTSEEFLILDTLESRGKHYIALAPKQGDNYYIYGFNETGDNVNFYSIEDENEYTAVAKTFEQRLAGNEIVTTNREERMDEYINKAKACYAIIDSKASSNSWVQGVSGVFGFPWTLAADVGVIPGIYAPLWSEIRAVYKMIPVSTDAAVPVIKNIIPEVLADLLLDKGLGQIPIIGIYFNAICAKAMTWRLGVLFTMLSARGDDIVAENITECMRLIRHLFPQNEMFKFTTPDKNTFIKLVTSVSDVTTFDYKKKISNALASMQ